jgi:ketosteroid isomerase-like protein
MKTRTQVSIFFVLLLFSCRNAADTNTAEIWKQEIREVERDFAAMAAEVGIPEAFLHYAAADAVLMRNERLIVGRQQLTEYFDSNTAAPREEKLSWQPDFVDVSESGDLAYTYGKYTYSYTDSTGSTLEHSGIFHTVWKRQADGTWRFVWD